MKKMILLAVLAFALFGSVKAQEQEIQLTAEAKQELMDEVTSSLKEIIRNFDGQYSPGTSIDHMYQISDTEARIEGMVNYIGKKCGDVRTRYYVTIIVEGSNVYKKACIYTPYCWLGQIVKHEWDCRGQKSLVEGSGDENRSRNVARFIIDLLLRSR